ncbi:MAG: hypothetical protein QNL01_01860 [Akkermansiaceae bacterium]|tara:strand:+ start:2601 stop:3305 length:705 start_codon:yes stop_codon:yes gene_type:complete
MNNIFITCCLLISMGGALFGQNKEEASMYISIYAFDYAKEHKSIFLADKKDHAKEVKLSNANILGPFKTIVEGDSKITLRSQANNKEGKTIYPAITQVKIPANIKAPLLILFPVPGAQVYKAIVVDRSLSNFPKGSYKLINVSPSAIRGGVGKTKIIAPSKKITPFNPSSNREKLLDVHFQYKRTSDWKTFGRTRWVNEKEKRSLLCAYLDPKTKRMKIRGIIVKPLPPRKKTK